MYVQGLLLTRCIVGMGLAKALPGADASVSSVFTNKARRIVDLARDTSSDGRTQLRLVFDGLCTSTLGRARRNNTSTFASSKSISDTSLHEEVDLPIDGAAISRICPHTLFSGHGDVVDPLAWFQSRDSRRQMSKPGDTKLLNNRGNCCINRSTSAAHCEDELFLSLM